MAEEMRRSRKKDLLTSKRALTPKPQNPHVYVCGVINNRTSLIIIIA